LVIGINPFVAFSFIAEVVAVVNLADCLGICFGRFIRGAVPYSSSFSLLIRLRVAWVSDVTLEFCSDAWIFCID